MAIKDFKNDAFVARNGKVPMPMMMVADDFDGAYYGAPNRGYDYVVQDEEEVLEIVEPKRTYEYVVEEEEVLEIVEPNHAYDCVLQEEEVLEIVEPDCAYDCVLQEEDVITSSQIFTRDPYSNRVWQSRGDGVLPPDNVGHSMWQVYY